MPGHFDRRFVLMGLSAAALAPRVAVAQRLAGATALARSLAPLSGFASLPAYEHVCLSPNGKRVGFVADSARGRAVCDLDLDSDDIAAIPVGKDPVTYLMWADDDNMLVVTSPGRPIGPFAVHMTLGGIVDVRSGKRKQIRLGGLVHPFATNNYQRVRIDGRNRLTVPDYNHASSRIMGSSLVSYSLDSGRMFEMDVDGQPILNWVVRPDGQVVARSEYDDRTGVWKIRYKSEKGWHEIFRTAEKIDVPSLCGLGRDGQSLLVWFETGEHGGHYAEIAPDGAVGEVFQLDSETYYPLFSNRTYALAGFAGPRSIDACVLFDGEMKPLPALVAKALPNARNYLVDYAKEPRQAIIYSEGAEDVGTYYYFNFLTGDYSEIGSPYPELSPGDIGEQSRFTYKAQDGLEIEAFLTLPPGSPGHSLPVVVLPHGGLGDYDSEGFDWVAQAIASCGYAVVQPNYRGSGGYGYAFRAAGHGEIAGKVLSDLSDAVSHLAGQGIVDAGRAAIVGRDIGGYLALASVTVQAGPYRCAVGIAAVTDVGRFMDQQREDFGFDDDAAGLVYIKRYFGDKAQWDNISPINRAGDAVCPILEVNGLFDEVWFSGQANDFHGALTKAGKVSELVVLKDDNVALYTTEKRRQALEAVAAFLEEHNPV